MAGPAPGGEPGKPPRGALDQLRDLHTELEALADGLTVTEPARDPAPPTAPSPRRRRRPVRPAPTLKAAALAEINARLDDTESVPQGLAGQPEPPDDAPRSAGNAVEQDARLFAPVRTRPQQHTDVPDDIDPRSRPWTVEAAREPLPPLSPSELAARGVQPEPPRRSWLMTGVVLVAAAAALFVLIASHLDLGHTSAPSFAVNEMVALKDAADTSITPTGHFLTTAPRIDLQVAYVGAAQGDTLTLQVLYAGSEFAAHTYDLTPGTSTAGGPLTPTGVDFKPGVYEIAAIWHGTRLRTADFTVDPPQPPPGATPAVTDTPAPAADATPSTPGSTPTAIAGGA